MKPTMIIPAAGLSTRYGLARPKFLLQHPEGRSMLAAGVAELPGEEFSEALVVSLRGFFEGLDADAIGGEIAEALGCPVRLILLDSPTPSMVATIARGIEEMDSDAPIVIKDTDNLIAVPDGALPLGENFVTFVSLRDVPHVVAANKSYVQLDAQGFITNIVEKRVVSGEFNSGLVGFVRASTFLTAARTLSGASEIFVSDIIRSALDEGNAFTGVKATTYEDWGTLEDWRAYCRSFSTIFVDVDGVVAINEHPHGSGAGGWGRVRPIQENVDALLGAQATGRCTLVFTTSRAEEFRDPVARALTDLGFDGFQLIMGLPHAGRVLINDFAPTNPYPSARAINLPRNDATLGAMLHPQ